MTDPNRSTTTPEMPADEKAKPATPENEPVKQPASGAHEPTPAKQS